MRNKLFVDTRTGEIKTKISVLESKFMKELKAEDVIDNTQKEIEMAKKKERTFRKLHGFDTDTFMKGGIK